MAERVVFLDACVLFPPLVRGILLRLAAAGLFTPRWSPRVLAEWRIAAARKGGMAGEDQAETAAAEMAALFPGASIEPAPDSEFYHHLPDPADAHVLAAAIAGGAEVLLTYNIRDFPARKLAAHGIAPRHPDGFLWKMLSHDREEVGTAIREAAAGTGAEDTESIRRALKRAHLPRLARAWSAEQQSRTD